MPSPSPPPAPESGLTHAARLHRRVVLQGPTGSGATTRLRDHHRTLIREGVPASTVLALVPTHAQDHWRADGPGEPTLGVSTFQTWIRRELEAYWPLIEVTANLPPVALRRHGRLVDFCSSTMARHRLDRATHGLRDAGRWEERLRSKPTSQVGQLFEVHGFAIDHQLPLEEASERLMAAWVGHEGARRCRGQVAEAIAGYRDQAFRDRVLDSALQRHLFLTHLWPLESYQATLPRRFAHLVVDEWEASTPLMQTVIGSLVDQVETTVVTVATDKNEAGGGADPDGARRLVSDWWVIPCGTPAAPAPLLTLGSAFYDRHAGGPVRPVEPGEHLALRLSFLSRPAMLKAVIQDLRGLLGVGTRPDHVAIVLPTTDRFAVWFLTAELNRMEIPWRFLTPTMPLQEHHGVAVISWWARRLYQGWSTPGTLRDQALFEACLGLDPLTAAAIADGRSGDLRLGDSEVDGWPTESQAAWGRWTGVLERYRTSEPQLLSRWLRVAFQDLWVPMQGPEGAGPIEQLVTLAEEFEAVVAAPAGWSSEVAAIEFLNALDNGLANERPSETPGVLLASGEAYARSGPPVAFQFWLDLGAESWRRPLRRELFDPVVLSRGWSGELDTPETEDLEAELRLAASWRTTLLKCRKAVRWYASDTDEEGREQTGGMLAVWEALLGSRYAGLEGSP